MSALSSATRISVKAACASGDSTSGVPYPSAVTSSSGSVLSLSHPLASSTKDEARTVGEAEFRAARIRSRGRWAVPARMLTVKHEPLPLSLSTVAVPP
jgi:hypothetical protein